MDFNGEKGLLGLAFHPNYSQNRRFFLNYDRVLNGEMQLGLVVARLATCEALIALAKPRSGP